MDQIAAKSNANDFFVYCRNKERQKAIKKERARLIFCSSSGFAKRSFIFLKHPALTWMEGCTCRKEKVGFGSTKNEVIKLINICF